MRHILQITLEITYYKSYYLKIILVILYNVLVALKSVRHALRFIFTSCASSFCPRSLMDKTRDSGSWAGGSIPSEGAILLFQ